MGLFRIIFLAILVGTGVWLWRRLTRSTFISKPNSTGTMVRCAQCDVHLPQERALQKDQQWYCSREHLIQGPNARD